MNPSYYMQCLGRRKAANVTLLTSLVEGKSVYDIKYTHTHAHTHTDKDKDNDGYKYKDNDKNI